MRFRNCPYARLAPCAGRVLHQTRFPERESHPRESAPCPEPCAKVRWLLAGHHFAALVPYPWLARTGVQRAAAWCYQGRKQMYGLQRSESGARCTAKIAEHGRRRLHDLARAWGSRLAHFLLYDRPLPPNAPFSDAFALSAAMACAAARVSVGLRRERARSAPRTARTRVSAAERTRNTHAVQSECKRRELRKQGASRVPSDAVLRCAQKRGKRALASSFFLARKARSSGVQVAGAQARQRRTHCACVPKRRVKVPVTPQAERTRLRRSLSQPSLQPSRASPCRHPCQPWLRSKSQ